MATYLIVPGDTIPETWMIERLPHFLGATEPIAAFGALLEAQRALKHLVAKRALRESLRLV
jgi:hypothetical protein